MMHHLLKFLYRRIWPSHKHDLIIRTFLGDSQQSSILWGQWSSQYDLDSLNWEDQKLLVRIAPLISQLFPNSLLKPRIEGIAKSHWTRSQILLKNSNHALEVLTASSIPFIILKGAAMQAYGFKSIGPRICSDLDLMVRVKDFPLAIEQLYAQNWKSRNSSSFAKTIWQLAAGINLRKAPFGDIDVHHQPIGIRIIPEDVVTSIWMRASSKDFLGQQVLVPGIADMVVILACHVLKDRGQAVSGVWIFDLMSLINMDINATYLRQVANQYQARLPVMAMLSYVYQVTGNRNAKSLLREFEDAPIPINEILHFLADSSKKARLTLQSVLFKLINWVVRHGDYRYFHMKIPKSYPIWMPDFLLKPIEVQSSKLSLLRHTVFLQKSTSNLARTVVEITFTPNINRKYQFDLIIDGKFISRLRVNISKSKCNKNIRSRFYIPLKNQPQLLEIESLNKSSLMTVSNNDRDGTNNAIPFSVYFFAVRGL